MKVGVLLLAAGSGKRFGSDIPKQYLDVAGQPLILHTLDSLNKEPRIEAVLPVIGEGDVWFSDAVANKSWSFDLLDPVLGGEERSISMQRGLEALPADIDMVAVHDAARALPSAALLEDVLNVAIKYGAAVPGLPVHDTIKCINEDGKVLETPDRSRLVAVQTPQVAKRIWFEVALHREKDRLHLHTDDASVLEAAGFDVFISKGDVKNRKVTTPHDMEWLKEQLQGVI